MFGVRWWIRLGVGDNVLELVALFACLVVKLIVGGAVVLEWFRIALVLVFVSGARDMCIGVVDWWWYGRIGCGFDVGCGDVVFILSLG